jgi:hypothetical protein
MDVFGSTPAQVSSTVGALLTQAGYTQNGQGGWNPPGQTSTSNLDSDQQSALTTITSVLSDYGLSSLASWAWGEVTNGVSSAQMLLDMYQTPQFQQRFPGIAIRQAKGLPAISPADYVSYEDSMTQLENQYGLPQGTYDNPAAIGEMIGNDVSINEATARIQNGYAQVATAAPEVRAAFAANFGAAGDGALAAYMMDESRSVPVLEQQVTAAQLQGTAAMSSIDVNGQLAMKLAQAGISQSQMQTAAGNVEQQQALFNQNPGEANAPTQAQGIQAQLGTDAQAAAEVAQAQSARASAFKGGGGAESDQYGAEGVGSAHAF